MKKIFLIGIMVAVVLLSVATCFIFAPGQKDNVVKADIVHPDCSQFSYFYFTSFPDNCWTPPLPSMCRAQCGIHSCSASISGWFYGLDQDMECYCQCFSDGSGGIT